MFSSELLQRYIDELALVLQSVPRALSSVLYGFPTAWFLLISDRSYLRLNRPLRQRAAKRCEEALTLETTFGGWDLLRSGQRFGLLDGLGSYYRPIHERNRHLPRQHRHSIDSSGYSYSSYMADVAITTISRVLANGDVPDQDLTPTDLHGICMMFIRHQATLHWAVDCSVGSASDIRDDPYW